jgi:LacI family transcriptional regulator
MGRKVTIEDVARQSNASSATVSLVLRQKPGISPETRQRVLDAARSLGYQPRTPFTASNVPVTRNIGLIVRARTRAIDKDRSAVNSFYSWVVTGLDAAARQQRLNLLYATVPVDEDNHPFELPRHLLEQSLDGLLLVGSLNDETIEEMVGSRTVPVVLVDAPAHPSRFDVIASENELGAYRGVSYLIGKGHRDIAFVGARLDANPNFGQRREGYLRALREHGLTPYIANDDRVTDDVAHATQVLLKRAPQITAIFGSNDAFAIEALRAAQAHGYRIPDDISVVGFDDIELSQQTMPALTTMAVDKVSMGRLAIQTLVYRLAWPEAAITLTTLQPRLVERQSVRMRG